MFKALPSLWDTWISVPPNSNYSQLSHKDIEDKNISYNNIIINYVFAWLNKDTDMKSDVKLTDPIHQEFS